MKDKIKEADEQPDQEMHRAQSGRASSPGASVPVYHPPSVQKGHQPRSFLNLVL